MKSNVLLLLFSGQRPGPSQEPGGSSGQEEEPELCGRCRHLHRALDTWALNPGHAWSKRNGIQMS